MKILVLTCMSVALFGADLEKTPKPVPAERHEDISKKMLAAQSAQIQAMQAQVQAEKAIKAAEAAMKVYEDLRTALQKEFGAEGCDLSLEKTWVGCPEKK